MKQLFVFSLVMFWFSSFSQNDNYDYFPKQSIAKLNPASFTFGKISLGYEHVLENNKSLALQIGIPLNTELPQSLLDELNSENIVLDDSSIQSFSVRPSYRMYLSAKKRGPKGLYFEPSLKYQQIELEGSGTFTADDNTIYPIGSDNRASTFGAGLQLGSQWLVSDVFSIDLFFLGPEINFGSVESSTIDNGAISPSDRQELVNEIDEEFADLPLIGDYEVTATDTSIDVETTGSTIPGFRFGVQFGFAF